MSEAKRIFLKNEALLDQAEAALAELAGRTERLLAVLPEVQKRLDDLDARLRRLERRAGVRRA